MLRVKTGMTTVPNTFINGTHVGGANDTLSMHSRGELVSLLRVKTHDYEYDLVSDTSGPKEQTPFLLCSCDFIGSIKNLYILFL